MEENNLIIDSKEARKDREKLIEENPNNPIAKSVKDSNYIKDESMKILEEGDPLEFLLDTISKFHVGDAAIITWHILSGLSSGFKNRKYTIHLAVVGDSGKGKSTVQDHTGLIFDKIETVTSSSAKSQFYKAGAGKMVDGGIIRFDESEGSEEALVLERALTDKSLSVPTHDTVSINKTFQQLKIKEINAVWKNSVNPPKDDQLNNRYTLLNVDESQEQDQEVSKRQIQEYCYNKNNNEEIQEIKIAKSIINEIKSESTKIIIPYGDWIRIDDNYNRRTLPKFLNLLRAITYCYRLQRKSFGEYYISTRKDFEIAQLLWEKTAELEKTHLNENQQILLKIMPTDEEGALGRLELAKKINKSVSTVYNYLTGLIDNGLVSYKEVIVDSARKKVYWVVKGCQPVSITVDWSKINKEDLYSKFYGCVGKFENVDEFKFYDIINNSYISEKLTFILKNKDKLVIDSIKEDCDVLTELDSS